MFVFVHLLCVQFLPRVNSVLFKLHLLICKALHGLAPSYLAALQRVFTFEQLLKRWRLKNHTQKQFTVKPEIFMCP